MPREELAPHTLGLSVDASAYVYAICSCRTWEFETVGTSTFDALNSAHDAWVAHIRLAEKAGE